MERSTVVTLLIVAGLGGLVLWWYMRDTGAATPAGATVPNNCGSGVMGSIGQFIKGHVDRKNSVAPIVGQKYTKVPASVLAPITNIAGKLSPSNWLEGKVGNAVGNFFCDVNLPSLSSLGNAFVNAGTFGAKEGAKAVGAGISVSKDFGATNLKGGTVGPVKSLASAGNNLVHGNFGDAGKDIAKSVYEGPKTAVTSTYNALKSLSPF